MIAAVLVVIIAGVELADWGLRGRTRLVAGLAWLVIALVAAGITGAVGGWGLI